MDVAANDPLSGLGGMRSMRLAQMARASAGAAGNVARPAGAVRGADRVEVDFARARAREAADGAQGAEAARTADAGLGEIGGMLTEVSGLVSTEGAEGGQTKVDAILADVDRVAGTTRHGGARLLDGSAVIRAGGKSVAISGMSSAQLGRVEANGATYRLRDLKSGGALAGADANVAGAVVNAALGEVGRARADLAGIGGGLDVVG